MKARLSAVFILLLGVAGLLLQYQSLQTAFDSATNLPLPAAPWLTALEGFTAAVVVLAVVFAFAAEQPDPYRRGAGQPRVYAALSRPQTGLGCLAGALIVVGGLWQLQIDFPLVTGALALATWAMDLLMAAAGMAMLWLVLSGGRQERPLAALLPGFSGCFWLVLYYHDHAQDPVVVRYCWPLLCLIAAILAFYFQAGSSFGRLRPRITLTLTLVAGVFSFTAVPAADTPAQMLILAGFGVWMLLQSRIMFHPAVRQEGRRLKQ